MPLAAALAACGFQPAYAPGDPARALQGQVEVADPSDKYGFDLVTRLEERMGRASDPKYRLGYVIKACETGVAITPENVITRYQVVGKIDYTLTNLDTGKVVTSGETNSFTSYSAAGNTVSTLTDEASARTRLMTILADQIMTRLIATAGTWAK